MQIITSKTEWTPVSETIHARIWDNKVWRKEFSPYYFGGYQIKHCHKDSRIAREWLADFGHSHATCSPEVASMIDPDGSLRRAGLLSVA